MRYCLFSVLGIVLLLMFLSCLLALCQGVLFPHVVYSDIIEVPLRKRNSLH